MNYKNITVAGLIQFYEPELPAKLMDMRSTTANGVSSPWASARC
jgi:hypothetical protein